jgi:hypothetical protein
MGPPFVSKVALGALNRPGHQVRHPIRLEIIAEHSGRIVKTTRDTVAGNDLTGARGSAW